MLMILVPMVSYLSLQKQKKKFIFRKATYVWFYILQRTFYFGNYSYFIFWMIYYHIEFQALTFSGVYALST
jgi:hypothetical protein